MSASALRTATAARAGTSRSPSAYRARARPVRVSTPLIRRSRQVEVRAETSTPPSHAPASNELEALNRVTCVVPDSMLSELEAGTTPKAASVNPAVILGILKSPYGQAQFKQAVAGALAYDKCRVEVGDLRIACQLDKAMVNVGTMLAEKVEGRVSTEVDPRLANDTDAIIQRVKILAEMYEEDGLKNAKSKILYNVPATWEGIQAVKQLEKQGFQCHVVHCYSFIQAVAAAQAGASVIQMNIGRIDDWYNKHPGFIRDTSGPRQDAGLVSDVDPGVKLMKKVYNYVKKYHPDTQLIGAGIRTESQTLQLAGLEYIVATAKVIKTLSDGSTLQGFNDGLRGDKSADDMVVQLSLEMAKAADTPKVSDVSEAEFVEELGYMGFDLLKNSLAGSTANIQRCEPFFMQQVGGQE